MKKIAELTSEQESIIPEWAEKWTKVGLSTEPADFDKAIAAAKKAYSLCGLDEPLLILKVGSPYAANVVGPFAYETLKEVLCKVNDMLPKVKEEHTKTRNMVSGTIFSKVFGLAWGQIYSRISFEVHGQIGDQVLSQIGSQLWDRVNRRLIVPIQSRIRGQINNPVLEQTGTKISKRVGSQVSHLVWDQVRSQVTRQIMSQVGGETSRRVVDEISAKVWSQVGGKVGGLVSNWVNNQIWDQGSSKTPFAYNEGVASLGCSHTSYFTFFRDVCGLELSPEILERISINEDLVTSCGWTWWHENILVISDRPKKINLDAEGRLHCENGPSIEYRDGWSLYNWHGVYIPKEWVTTKKPTAKEALTWEDIEQRRAACEILGWANVLKELDAKTIDEDGDPEIGTLVECSIPDSGKERFLRVLCGTSREFVIPVPRQMKTAIEANSWTWGLSSEEYKPEVRT